MKYSNGLIHEPKPVVDWISEQVSARQTFDETSSKRVINQISTVARGAHPLLVVALAMALAALVIAIETFVTVITMLLLCWAAIVVILARRSLRCSYTDRSQNGANQLKVVSAL